MGVLPAFAGRSAFFILLYLLIQQIPRVVSVNRVFCNLSRGRLLNEVQLVRNHNQVDKYRHTGKFGPQNPEFLQVL
jgi:hypothetical protein